MTQIRPARSGEYDTVGAITLAAYDADGFVPPGSDYGSVLLDAAGRAEKAELWVATDHAGAVVGTVTYCRPGSPYREIAPDDHGEFRMLAVDPAARGTGVGSALTRHCITRSRELGFRGLTLSSAKNMAAAHRLYERLGFVRRPDLDWAPIPGVDLIAYVLTFEP